MASRPVYMPAIEGSSLVVKVDIEFKWIAGMAVSQKQKSIRALHEAAAKNNVSNVLEISSKSESLLGIKLSAFNLLLTTPSGLKVAVENAFQSSKIFQHGGPYLDLLHTSPREAKKDPRLTSSGDLIGFNLEGEDWASQPLTAFYDWLYLTALIQSPSLSGQLLAFDGFTDIEFNPDRSINCQAASAALFVSLSRRGKLEETTSNRDVFIERMRSSGVASRPVQSSFLIL